MSITTILNKIIKDKEVANTLKVTELVLILKEASDKYYNTNTPIMSDSLFDYVLSVLKRKSPKNPYLKTVGAPVPNKDKVKLPYPMASLDKIKPDHNVNIYDKWLEKYTGPYYISDKLDGVSALLHVKDGYVKMYTRGDGLYGQNISHLISKIIFSKTKSTLLIMDHLKSIGEVAIRGELIISRTNFKIFNKNNDFKNARGAIAGLVNSKTVNDKLSILTEFIAYSVVYPNILYSKQIELINRINMNCVEHYVASGLNLDTLQDYFKVRRSLSEYEVDGIVVMDSSNIYPLVNVVENPDYGFAFKMLLDDQSAITNVISVEWECSKHGYIKPRVKINPIQVVDVTITYATAFNAKYVNDNKLGPGAIIEIARSGDVIPDIQQVIKPALKPSFPSFKFTWSDSGVDIIADPSDVSCKKIISIKKIVNFFETIGVKNLNEGIVTKLFDNGYNTVIKILSVKDKSSLTNISGLGDKIVKKVYSNIDSAMKIVTLDKLMAGTTLFGRGLGTRKFKMIMGKYSFNDIMIQDITLNMIIEVKGFDKLTAKQFLLGLQRFKQFYTKLSTIYDLKNVSKISTVKVSSSSSSLSGKKFVLSGTRDKDVEKYIEESGGTLSTGVSKNTFMVIYTDTTTSKYIKAIELGIATTSLSDFKKKYINT